MKWIELIRLLTAQKDVQALQDAIQAQIETLRNARGLQNVLAMRHATYGTDLAIVLVWNNEREPVKTREGLLLANCLQQFGSVDHAAWAVFYTYGSTLCRQRDKAMKLGEGAHK